MALLQVSDAELKSFNDLKNKEKFAFVTTSERLFNENKCNSEELVCLVGSNRTVTSVKFNEISQVTISTWNEVDVDNFDIISKMLPSKTFKIKARVRTIGKFNPKITLI